MKMARKLLFCPRLWDILHFGSIEANQHSSLLRCLSYNQELCVCWTFLTKSIMKQRIKLIGKHSIKLIFTHDLISPEFWSSITTLGGAWKKPSLNNTKINKPKLTTKTWYFLLCIILTDKHVLLENVTWNQTLFLEIQGPLKKVWQ